MPTGHAVVAVDERGENQIIIAPAANRAIPEDLIARTLEQAGPGDLLLLQNETNGTAEAARIARRQGARVIYSAAPFALEAAQAMLGLIDVLVLNAVEAAQLGAALGSPAEALGVPAVLVTRGAEGAVWIGPEGRIEQAAFAVEPIDTTGAGDCFTGALAGELDRGAPVATALRFAAAAAAIQVTRPGTAAAIPSRAEVEAFLAGHPG